MNILIINCHPDYEKDASVTNRLTAFTANALTKGNVTIKNIYDKAENVNPIDKEFLMVRGSDESQWTDSMRAIRANQNELIDEWMASDVIFIFSPLHNFGMTSKLKDYFDNILLANRTFKYVSGGSVGLMDNSTRVVYVQSSGSRYDQELGLVNSDLATLHVRTLLNFMGISQMELIRIQGLGMRVTDVDKEIASAERRLAEIVEEINM